MFLEVFVDMSTFSHQFGLLDEGGGDDVSTRSIL